MKAVVKTKPSEGIEILDLPMPQIKPNEVLVKVYACGICGTDLGIYEWRPADRFSGGKAIELPKVIGHEPSGVVIEVGSQVKDIKVGDRICARGWGGCGECEYCRLGHFNFCLRSKNIGQLADGAMAEYVAMPFFNLSKIPDRLSLEEAAIIEPLGIAVHAFETLVNFRSGQDIVVIGPGPIGLLEALVARASGAGKIFIVGLERDKQRLRIAEGLGFRVIEDNDKKRALDIVRSKTNGSGVDSVFVAISHGIPPVAIQYLKKIGQVVIISKFDGPVVLDASEMMAREIMINRSKGQNPSSFQTAIDLVANGRIDVKPVITHKIKVDEIETGFEMMKRSEALKILMMF